MIGSSDHPVLSFGLPPDAVAWAALIVALLIPFSNVRVLHEKSRLLLLALTAATLSWGYFLFYLGGAPRIIDATAYLLEARSFAQGSFSFEVPSPSASFRGRFLIHTADDAHRLAAIFPPGYPTLLALGIFFKSPFVIGPLLAGTLVVTTYLLAFSVTRRREDAVVAACFSALCACLRYHTAETMSHGFSAVLTTIALWSTVESMRVARLKHGVILGLSLGFLTATRQLNGAVLTCVTLGCLCLGGVRSLRFLGPALLGMLPGVALLLAHQHAITGEIFVSPQTRYYDFSDGPKGCFSLGLGSGCAYEHADVVAQQGGQGLTVGWMMRNTLHRFHYHLMDVAHFEPLVLVGVLGLFWGRKRRTSWPLIACLIGLPVGYSLFYFAGSYPGAGARLFSEMIPIWHVAIAWGLRRLRMVRWGIVACLVGFSLHASFGHRALSSSRFGPDLSPVVHLPALFAAPNNQKFGPRPLVLFRSAHEFNVAHLSAESFVAARRTRDSRESFLKDAAAASASFFYTNEDGFTELETTFIPPNAPLTFESEFDYPLLAKNDVWVHPEHLPHSCVSQGRALALHRLGSHPEIELEIPPNAAAGRKITLKGVTPTGQCVSRTLEGAVRGDRVVVNTEALRNLSHIDRLVLTPTHP